MPIRVRYDIALSLQKRILKSQKDIDKKEKIIYNGEAELIMLM
jgi:hypothetical protein